MERLAYGLAQALDRVQNPNYRELALVALRSVGESLDRFLEPDERVALVAVAEVPGPGGDLGLLVVTDSRAIVGREGKDIFSQALLGTELATTKDLKKLGIFKGWRTLVSSSPQAGIPALALYDEPDGALGKWTCGLLRRELRQVWEGANLVAVEGNVPRL